MSVVIVEISETYSWSSYEMSFVLSGFYYGYISTQVLGGHLSLRYGGKRVLLVGKLGKASQYARANTSHWFFFHFKNTCLIPRTNIGALFWSFFTSATSFVIYENSGERSSSYLIKITCNFVWKIAFLQEEEPGHDFAQKIFTNRCSASFRLSNPCWLFSRHVLPGILSFIVDLCKPW